jgi:hypothetical protein
MYLPYFKRLIGDDDFHGKTYEAVPRCKSN